MGVTMSIEYLGELRCRLRHEPSSTEMNTDAPLDNMGKGEAFSPTDLVGAALLSCAVTTMGIVGKRENIPLSRATGKVTKEMASDPRRIGQLTLSLTLDRALSPEQRARLEAIAHGCPVALSLASELRVEMHFEYR